jgi:hypothetical protein
MTMQSIGWTAVCLLLLFALGWGKPYQTPLVGRVGGKRTLVLLDDMVRRAKNDVAPMPIILAMF